MSLVVTQDCRPYWRYELHDLAAGQVIPDGEFADYLLASGSPVQPQGGADAEPDGVPDGTVAEVLDWVGDDPERATQALQVEQHRGSPRSTLVAALEKVAQPAGGSGAVTED